LIVFEDIATHVDKAIRRHGLPCIYVNTPIPPKCGGVLFDEASGVRQAIRHLRQRGRKKMAFLHQGDAFYNKARRQALESLCLTAGLSRPPALNLGPKAVLVQAGSAFEQGLAFLRQHSGIDALILDSDRFGHLAYALADRMGLRVGRDLAVVSFSGDVGGALYPAMTTLHVDTRPLAELIFAELVRLVQGQTPRVRKVKYRLHVRESS
jgi:LacI family transcriptional regulator